MEDNEKKETNRGNNMKMFSICLSLSALLIGFFAAVFDSGPLLPPFRQDFYYEILRKIQMTITNI